MPPLFAVKNAVLVPIYAHFVDFLLHFVNIDNKLITNSRLLAAYKILFECY
jgi:hypothetical protein